MGTLKEEAERIATKVAKATGKQYRALFQELTADPEDFADKYKTHLTATDLKRLGDFDVD